MATNHSQTSLKLNIHSTCICYFLVPISKTQLLCVLFSKTAQHKWVYPKLGVGVGEIRKKKKINSLGMATGSVTSEAGKSHCGGSWEFRRYTGDSACCLDCLGQSQQPRLRLQLFVVQGLPDSLILHILILISSFLEMLKQMLVHSATAPRSPRLWSMLWTVSRPPESCCQWLTSCQPATPEP